MQAAGMTPMQVLVAAPRGGARAMGLEKEIGTLEKGKAADLLVWRADPTTDVANLRQTALGDARRRAAVDRRAGHGGLRSARRPNE